MTPTEAGRIVDRVAAKHFAALDEAGISGALAMRHVLIYAVLAGVPLESPEAVDAYLEGHTGPAALRRSSSSESLF